MEAPLQLTFGLTLTVIGVLTAFLGWRAQRRRALLENTSPQRPDAAYGFSDIAGHAVPAGPVVDPVFRQPCVYYRVSVSERRPDRDHKSYDTVNLLREDSGQKPFFLEDQGAKAQVFPAGADLEFPPALRREVLLEKGIEDAHILEFLRAIKDRTQESVVITLHVLHEGDPLHVIGYAKRGRDGVTLRGSWRGPYILSTVSGRELADKYGRFAALSFVGGVTLASFGLALLFRR